MVVCTLAKSGSRPIGNSVASQNTPGRFASGRLSDAEDVPVRTVTEIVLVVPSATLDGVTLQVEFVGNPVHVKVTVPETFAAEPSKRG